VSTTHTGTLGVPPHLPTPCGTFTAQLLPQVPQCPVVVYLPANLKVSSVAPSQSSSLKSQVSTLGIGPWQAKPAAPEQMLTPGQLPTSGTVLAHAAPCDSPSSSTPLQSLSAPSQISTAGAGAEHSLQPVPTSQV
jgi:hypothetical protein